MTSYLPSVQGFIKGTLASAVGLSTLTAGLLYYGQNYLIYPSYIPQDSRTVVDTPDLFGLPYEDLTLDTVDGIKIKCFLLLQRKSSPDTQHSYPPSDESEKRFAASRPTVIMFHGNAGNCGHRLPLARVLFSHLACNVMMVEYRGYGLSQGNPSEKGFRIDAQTALDYITSHPDLGPSKETEKGSKIIVYGQSIGGAVSLDLCARNPNSVTGLILENTFLSIPRLIPTAMPALSPFSFLCHQKWDNANAITKIPLGMTLLMLSGSRDEVVPAIHMEELWSIAKKSGKANVTFAKFSDGTHNDTCVQPGYWEYVRKFIESLESD